MTNSSYFPPLPSIQTAVIRTKGMANIYAKVVPEWKPNALFELSGWPVSKPKAISIQLVVRLTYPGNATKWRAGGLLITHVALNIAVRYGDTFKQTAPYKGSAQQLRLHQYHKV